MMMLKHWVLGHDAIYDATYFAGTIEGPAIRSSDAISRSILEDFRPRRVIDVGCGTGALLAALRDRGCEVAGLEYAEAALDYCRARRLDVRKFDLEREDLHEGLTFDVAVSMEVAEHLPERVSERYVDLLTRLSRVVVFSAARPGQGGSDHVNEQWPAYWVAKFEQRGFASANGIADRWRESWKSSGTVESWYYENLLVLVAPAEPH